MKKGIFKNGLSPAGFTGKSYGCFDLTAVPMLNGPLTTRFLQVAETGVFPWPAE